MMSHTGKHARSDRYLFAGIKAPVAILQMQCDHAIAKTVEQGWHIGTPGIRPVGVDLQNDLRRKPIREYLKRMNAADLGFQLEMMVVVTDPETVSGRPLCCCR